MGDLVATKWRNYEALTEALEARFVSQHRTEMYRAQLRCRLRGHEEMLPELFQAVQRLACQAYPAAPSSLQDTLARDHFIDALPDSDVVAHSASQAQMSKRSIDDSPRGLEEGAFYVADKHRTKVQARAVLPYSIDPPISEYENDLQKQVVNQLLTKWDQPPWRCPGSRQLPAKYFGCFTCHGLDHM